MKKSTFYFSILTLALFSVGLVSAWTALSQIPDLGLKAVPEADRSARVGELMSFNLIATGYDSAAELDFDAVPLPAGAELATSTGYFSWIPQSDQEGDHNIVFSVSDGSGRSFSMATVLKVAPANRAPVFVNIPDREVQAGDTLLFTVTANDPDGDEIVYGLANLPVGATFSSAGAFSWATTDQNIGTSSLQFRAGDGLATATMSVLVTVSAVEEMNRAPVIAAITDKHINENDNLTFSINATDADGDVLSYAVDPLPAGASLNAVSGYFSWTPNFNQAGTYNLIASASDGQASATTSLKITVHNQNRAPQLSLDYHSPVNAGEQIVIVANGSDPDGDHLVYNINDNRFVQSPIGTFKWTPSATGTYVFTVQAGDGRATTSANANVRVADDNQAPVISAPSTKTVYLEETMILSFSVSDPDGDTVVTTVSGLPSGMSFDQAALKLTWTPSASQGGTYSILIKASDGIRESNRTLTLHVVRRMTSDSSPEPGPGPDWQRILDHKMGIVEKRMEQAERQLEKKIGQFQDKHAKQKVKAQEIYDKKMQQIEKQKERFENIFGSR